MAPRWATAGTTANALGTPAPVELSSARGDRRRGTARPGAGPASAIAADRARDRHRDRRCPSSRPGTTARARRDAVGCVTGPADRRAVRGARSDDRPRGATTATFDFLSTPGPDSTRRPSPSRARRRAPASGHHHARRRHQGDDLGAVAPEQLLLLDPERDRSGPSPSPATRPSTPIRTGWSRSPRSPGFGAITVTRVDGTRLWETGGGNYGLDPGSDGGTGLTALRLRQPGRGNARAGSGRRSR